MEHLLLFFYLDADAGLEFHSEVIRENDGFSISLRTRLSSNSENLDGLSGDEVLQSLDAFQVFLFVLCLRTSGIACSSHLVIIYRTI